MGRKFLMSIIICSQLITITGCWDYQDINKVAFPQLGAYDLHQTTGESVSILKEDEKRIDLTVVIPNISQESEAKYRIEKVPGILIGSARGQIPYSMPGLYSPAVAATIVFGEDVAVSGLNKIHDALARGPKNPHTVNYTITEGRGENIIRAVTLDYATIGDYIRLLVRDSEKRAYIPSTTLHQFDVNQNPGKNPIMPILAISNDKVVISGTAIFKKDKMVGKVDLRETQYLMMLRGIKSMGSLPFELQKDGQIYDYGSVTVKNDRRVKVERNGDEYTFTINVILKAELSEHALDVTFTDNEDLVKAISQQVEADVRQGCTKFVETMQTEHKLDCIDISKYALAKWRPELESKIDEGFIEKASIKVDVKVDLISIGETN